MKILVISDTHIPVAVKNLPPKIEEAARRSDCCLHAGDMIEYGVFERLSQLTKTYGVCGNMDDESVAQRLPRKQVITLEGITIGLTHGYGAPDKVINSINRIFADEFDKIDVFVFGHSHLACNIKKNGKLYFNPGSLTDKIFSPKRTYGILTIDGKKISAKVVNFE